jgi:hypothetical protein
LIDERVRTALRSDAALVVIEAPAGCGKTHQGAEYVGDLLQVQAGRILILTHTHAACSVFVERLRGAGSNAEIRTIDSLIDEIATAYHIGLGIPPEIRVWVRQQGDGHAQLATKVARLLKRYPMIARSLVNRYPTAVCDEHQDSSGDQHAIVMSLFAQGARIRIFADPMQKIFKEKRLLGGAAAYSWSDLVGIAGKAEELDFPHRWTTGCPKLGEWVMNARTALKEGRQVDLRNRPPSVGIVFAENLAHKNLDYRIGRDDRKPVDAFQKSKSSLLILTRHNNTARALRSFFFRSIPLWEGYTRTALDALVDTMQADGDAAAIAAGIVAFIGAVATGFSPSAFGDRFEQEVRDRCMSKARGKPATIQALAKLLVEEPNHQGAAKMLKRLHELVQSDPIFGDIKFDCHKEFWDAVRLGDFETPELGLADLAHRRAYSRPRPPDRAISTIHKAKGLECDSVIIAPCDSKTFPDKPDSRCLLYVALSRAKKALLLIVSRENPSPLLII